ncbi:helix-turn-helix domain-containing protein [Vibrio vulnificus]|uniref:helix-turn-helix domain-containing protein n=1 Tax=Vibrio vulnificus TaxID=672 RepID=UPI001A29C588|nr:helix-turn-helix domain-containing protein [Vibrio vulnificus]MCA0766325.1 helix-turn-helix domain-containing protein [Vibrio vulnificus]HAT8542815.1 helix-turn-helix domain-containing protein [Vibrio vulnificus]
MILKSTSYLACGISTVLSVIILASLGQGYTVIIFGLTALVIEVTKYAAFLARTITGAFLCFLLSVLSISASIGSLQSGMQNTQNLVEQYETKVSSIRSNIEALEAARKAYISEGFVTKALTLNNQIDELQRNLLVIEKPTLSASYGMIQTASQVFNVSVVTASNCFYILIAVIVDMCSFFLLASSFGGKKNEIVEEYAESVSTSGVQIETEQLIHPESIIFKLAEAGLSQRVIAKELGVSQSTVCRRLKRCRMENKLL